MTAVGLVIPAAGEGRRLGAEVPKALLPVGGDPLLVHAVRAAVASGVPVAVVVAAPAGFVDHVRALVEPEVPIGVVVEVVEGGDSRQESVRRALAALPAVVELVLVHDAARCLAPPSLHAAVAAALRADQPAVIPVVPVVDTLKQVDDHGAVVATPDRAHLRAVQTPQGFRRDLLEQAHRAATEGGVADATDDAGLVERLGIVVHVVPGDHDAFKITRPDDVLFAEVLLSRREARA